MKRRFSPLWLFLLLTPLAFVIWPRPRPSVARINRADPEVQAAAKRAVAELPRFIEPLHRGEPGKRFAVRAAFKTPEGPEYLWVRNISFDGANFQGDVDQDPIAAAQLKRGDHVKINRVDVYDWMIGHGSEIEGGYTEKALRQR